MPPPSSKRRARAERSASLRQLCAVSCCRHRRDRGRFGRDARCAPSLQISFSSSGGRLTGAAVPWRGRFDSLAFGSAAACGLSLIRDSPFGLVSLLPFLSAAIPKPPPLTAASNIPVETWPCRREDKPRNAHPWLPSTQPNKNTLPHAAGGVVRNLCLLPGPLPRRHSAVAWSSLTRASVSADRTSRRIHGM